MLRGAAVADGEAGRIGGGEDAASGMLGAVQTDKTAGLGRLGGKHCAGAASSPLDSTLLRALPLGISRESVPLCESATGAYQSGTKWTTEERRKQSRVSARHGL